MKINISNTLFSTLEKQAGYKHKLVAALVFAQY